MPSKEQAHSDNQSLPQHQAAQPEAQNATVPDRRSIPASAVRKARTVPQLLKPRDLLQLQRAVGNRAVGRLIGKQNSRSLADPEQHILQPDTVAISTQIRSSVQDRMIQRKVLQGQDKEGPYYYSDQDTSGTVYRKRTLAYSLDAIITEYNKLLAYVQGQMKAIPKEYLARIQRIKQNKYNSWVPLVLRTNSTLVTLHSTLVQARQRRSVELPYAYWNVPDNKWQTYAQLLINDGFVEAQDLLNNIQTLQPAQAAGYKYQLFCHMQEWMAYKLVAIEPKYGLPKPSTGYNPRADSKTVIGTSQSMQQQFYPVEHEKRTTVMTDFKVGYKNQQYAQGLWNEVNQYGGVAKEDGQLYGGLENTQSTPPQFHLGWYNNQPPQWFQNQLPTKSKQIREENPRAYPGGLYLGQTEILPPLENLSNRGSDGIEQKGISNPFKDDNYEKEENMDDGSADISIEDDNYDIEEDIDYEYPISQNIITNYKSSEKKGVNITNKLINIKDDEDLEDYTSNSLEMSDDEEQKERITKNTNNTVPISDEKRAGNFLKKVSDILFDGDIYAQPQFISWKDWKGTFDDWKSQVLDSTNGLVNESEVINRMAADIVNKISDILFDRNIYAQPQFISWKDWKGTFDDWKSQVLDSTNGLVNESDIKDL